MVAWKVPDPSPFLHCPPLFPKDCALGHPCSLWGPKVGGAALLRLAFKEPPHTHQHFSVQSPSPSGTGFSWLSLHLVHYGGEKAVSRHGLLPLHSCSRVAQNLPLPGHLESPDPSQMVVGVAHTDHSISGESRSTLPLFALSKLCFL